MLRSKPNSQRGDTIIEVMVAIVVVSLVLVAAYVATTRNISGLQDTSEHSTALQLAQTQIEYLHNVPISTVIANGCFDDTGKPVSGVAGTCLVKADGSPAGSTEPAYQLKLTAHPNAYEIQVQWASSGVSQSDTTDTDSVSLYYQP
jgi:prepilin-type N-terminal cleavage/methylation domain-containing protein